MEIFVPMSHMPMLPQQQQSLPTLSQAQFLPPSQQATLLAAAGQPQLPQVTTIGGTLPVHPALLNAQAQIHQHQQPLLLPLKRGSDELLSHSMVTNGTGMSPTQTGIDTNNDAKKVKLDQHACKASRVLHFRGVPSDCTEGEIVQLGLPFGHMTNLVLAKKKNQALLEMNDIACSTSMVDYFTHHPPQIRNRTVYVQFSNHEQLKTETSTQNAGAAAALQAAQQLMGNMEEPKTVLRVIVEHMLYPVTIDVLKQIFSRYGQVLKIVTFSKNNTFQALIQYSDAIAAQTSKVSLNGQNIYNGCCTLRIDFSKLPSLNVKYNNDKSRDYTNPGLPTGDGAMPGMEHPHAHLGFGAAGLAGLPGMQGMQAHMPFSLAQLPGAHQAIGAAGLRFNHGCPQTGAVLLVSNMNEQKVTPDALFTLFGVYGDVHRVKIMFNKKDNALVQFADPNQAAQALTHVDKLKVWGKQIKVAPSKHAVVQMPKEGQPDAGLTKDYTNSPLHRFKKPNSKNHHNIFPPSATLHLSNIPANVTEEQLQEAFTEHGEIVAFKFFQKDRKMALIQMATIEEAVHALIEKHNFQLGESAHLRVSFSKSTINMNTGPPHSGPPPPQAVALGLAVSEIPPQ